MGLEYLNDDLNIVSRLSNRPSETEPDELSPEEFKAKFDEAANIIKNYINEQLIPSITASNVPFASTSGNVQGDTVALAIEWLKEQMAQTQLGQIGDGTITDVKLTEEVQRILNSGKPVVSSEAPSGNYPIGQIWLRTDVNGAMKTMYIKATTSEWVAYTFDVLPINRGGTGLDRVETGSILYGNNGNLEKLAAPAETSFLHFGTKPEWKSVQETKRQLGFLTVATGEYKGTGYEGKVALVPTGAEEAITPTFICVYRKEGSHNDGGSGLSDESSVCLCNGAEAHQRMFIGSKNCFITVKLHGNELVFDNETDTKDDALAALMNFSDVEYCWTALY